MVDQAASTDDELLAAARAAPAGDTRPFEELVQRHRSRVLANCRYLTGADAEAEDLAQEVFVKAFFGLRRFEGRSAFATWVQRIKINHCLNYLRAQKGKAFVDVDDPSLEATAALQSPPDAEQDLAAGDDRRRIRAILRRMPDTLRVPLILRDTDGLSYQEVADLLELSLSAAKMRIKRAREEFRRQYEAGRA